MIVQVTVKRVDRFSIDDAVDGCHACEHTVSLLTEHIDGQK